jgi:hypothetical protein
VDLLTTDEERVETEQPSRERSGGRTHAQNRYPGSLFAKEPEVRMDCLACGLAGDGDPCSNCARIREIERAAEREVFLNALPSDVREEVLAQETAQRRRLAPLPPSPALLAQEQLAFLSSLPPDLREEVERDLLAQVAANATIAAAPTMPPADSTPRIKESLRYAISFESVRQSRTLAYFVC